MGRRMCSQSGQGHCGCHRGPVHTKGFGLCFKHGSLQRRGIWDPLASYLAPKGLVGPCCEHHPHTTAASRIQSIMGRDALKHKPKPKFLQTRGVVTRNISPVTSPALTDG